MAIPRDDQRIWPAVWTAVVLALLGVLLLESHFGRIEIGEGPRAPAKIVEAKLLPPFALPPESQATPETVARPLFVPTRRPPPPAASATAQTMKRGQFVLTGVSITPDVSFAFLRVVATGKTLSVRKGSQVEGITVESVEPRKVVMKLGEESEDLLLNVQVPARVAAAPAVSAAVPPAPGAAMGAGLPGPQGIPGAPGIAGAPGSGGPAPTGLPGGPGALAPPPGSGLPDGNAAATAQPGAPAAATTRRRPWMNN